MSTLTLNIEKTDYPNPYTGTRTEQNLWEAFIGESLARNKYTYFASVAKKAGYEEMADIFLETANNEKEHAKIWFKKLQQLSTHRENLLQASESELYEHSVMYARMAADALSEGFSEMAELFLGVAAIEKRHEGRFRKLLLAIDNDTVFSNMGIRMWECKNCGHITIASEAPDICPVCEHPRSYFQAV